MTRILVVGCSYGGLKTLLTLKRLLPNAELIGIDKSPYHVNITGFPRYVAGEISHLDLLLPLQEFLNKHSIDYWQEEVTGLSPNSKHLYTEKRRTEYDYLVLAFGASHNKPPVQPKDVFVPYTLEEVKELRSCVEQQIYNGKKVQAIIIGAGLAGIEWASGLKSYLGDKGNVTIIERSSTIIPGYGEKIRSYVERRLEKMKIEVKTDTNVESVNTNHVQTSKGKIPYTVVLWFGGVVNHPLVAKLGLPYNEKGLLVKSTLQSTAFQNIFCVGDIVSLADSQTQPIKRATSALIQGKIAAENITRHIIDEPLKTYEVHEMPLGIYLGPGKGLVHYKGIMYGGWLAWWSKKWRETHYL